MAKGTAVSAELPATSLQNASTGDLENRPKLILMGKRRSGKSSIANVVFHRMAPSDTLFLETTNKLIEESFDSFIHFSLLDTPGDDATFKYLQQICTGTSAIVFIIDGQDDYVEALSKLIYTARKAFTIDPKLIFDVFIHKVDSLSDDYRIDTQREIQQRVMDELYDNDFRDVNINFHTTSIFDHSIYEALSKVIQRLIPELPTLESLLDILCANSGIEKAFLFDVTSRVYIATDSSPTDSQSYEICADMIDVVQDISEIYRNVTSTTGYSMQAQTQALRKMSSRSLSTHPHRDTLALINNAGKSHPNVPGGSVTRFGHSFIGLANGMNLYLCEIDHQYLVLTCLVRTDSFAKKGIIDYNVHCFRRAVNDIYELQHKKEQKES